ncbi:SWI/SNF and RSC complex subunit Ssr2 [Entomophthora muscae]|uniref:SWI/SNF and RSC complex subunit Ssr2 n=1 Tax=Entomophthora muscae TaxID=34485 RepID=A0ACC2SKC5_9FUNG|nr:SWI/SNF and RSC complex subunit Ssr2 [Entomophthora muscae]
MTLNMKSGDVDWEFYNCPEILDRFEKKLEPLVAAIRKVKPEFPSPTAKDLANFTASLYQFQEDNLAPQALSDDSPRQLRLPAAFFRPSTDTKDKVFYMLSAAFIEMAHRQHLSWDLKDPNQREFFLKLLLHIETVLKSQSFLTSPKLAFSEDLPAVLRIALSDKAKKLGVAVVDLSASPTHIITQTPQDMGRKESRRVERVGGKVRVHWCFYPDSHDSWVAENLDLPLDDVSGSEATAPKKVYQRWLEDSFSFNELMNEEDYKVIEQLSSVDNQSSSVKRKQTDSPSVEENTKKIRSQEAESVPSLLYGKDQAEALDLEELAGKASNRIKKAELEPIVGGDVSNISLNLVPSKVSDSEKKENVPVDKEVIATETLIQQSFEVIIPSYSAWFEFSKIHEVEKKALPEFFNSRNKSKTPSIYKDFRDFMINTYRLNPSEYLTVTACRRNLAGDVCAIIRVHGFLEQWGLINYQIDPETRPSNVVPAYTGHFRITGDTPRGLQPFLPAVPLDNSPNHPTAETPKVKVSHDPHLELRQDIYQVPQKPAAGRYNCGTCRVECSKLRYHNIKTRDVDLCPNCYLQGRFPSSFFSGDFIKMDAAGIKAFNEEEWSDQEVLLLLEGLEMHQEDWDRVAEHVVTRTRDQCILKFLRLPIEDPYIEPDTKKTPLQHQRLPFSQAENPVMSVVAFLASAVNPGIASAAAQSALKELAKTNGVSESEEETTSDVPATNGKVSEGAESKNNGASGFSDTAIEKAAAAALGAAAAKAKLLADHEEREIKRLVYDAVETQIQKLELKLNQFDELESLLEKERQEMERQRLQLYVEFLKLKGGSLPGDKPNTQS